MGKQRKRAKPMLIHTATPERIMQAEGAVETKPTGQKIYSAPLDRLLLEGRITGREHDAGDRYRTDAYLARIDPSAPTVDWNSAGGSFGSRNPSMFTSQRIADARLRWRETERTINGFLKTVLDHALIHEHSLVDVVRLYGENSEHYARAAARAGIRMALIRLVEFYGK